MNRLLLTACLAALILPTACAIEQAAAPSSSPRARATEYGKADVLNPSGTPLPVRIVSYNIQGGCTAPMDEGHYNIAATIEVLRRLDADVIVLQEVSSRGARKGSCRITDNQSSWIPKKLGMKAFYYERLLVLVRSDFRIVKKQGFRFRSQDGEGANRGYVRVLLEGPDRRQFAVYNAHAERFDPSVRRAQITELRDKASQDGAPAVVAGDFNECAGYVAELFADGFVSALGDEVTFTPIEPTSLMTRQLLQASSGCNSPETREVHERIDYTFATIEDWIAYSADVVTTAGAVSDHYPVLTDLLLYSE